MDKLKSDICLSNLPEQTRYSRAETQGTENNGYSQLTHPNQSRLNNIDYHSYLDIAINKRKVIARQTFKPINITNQAK